MLQINSKIMRKALLTIFFFSFLLISKANTPYPYSDSIRISLLTCSPGDEIYTLFGHTAIRVTVPHTNYDEVYNYGIFDFKSDHFIWRFALGHTDYQLGKVPFDYFMYEYDFYKRSVWEQELNLTIEEKSRLVDALELNYQPQNRIYRYNFLFDNCATRPLDQIIGALHESLLLQDDSDKIDTFRSIIHKYTENFPWSQFGIDLCLGSDADKVMSIKDKTFIPIELMHILNHTIFDSKPIVKPIKELLKTPHKEETIAIIPTPTIIFSTLFFLFFLTSLLEYKKKKSYWVLDTFTFAIFGVVGCVLTFLALFSEHPTVSPNYLIILFHPLHLVLAPYIGYLEKKQKKVTYHYINLGVLTLFIVFFSLIPQNFDFAILPLAGCLWLRSLTNLLIHTKR